MFKHSLTEGLGAEDPEQLLLLLRGQCGTTCCRRDSDQTWSRQLQKR